MRSDGLQIPPSLYAVARFRFDGLARATETSRLSKIWLIATKRCVPSQNVVGLTKCSQGVVPHQSTADRPSRRHSGPLEDPGMADRRNIRQCVSFRGPAAPRIVTMWLYIHFVIGRLSHCRAEARRRLARYREANNCLVLTASMFSVHCLMSQSSYVQT